MGKPAVLCGYKVILVWFPAPPALYLRASNGSASQKLLAPFRPTHWLYPLPIPHCCYWHSMSRGLLPILTGLCIRSYAFKSSTSHHPHLGSGRGECLFCEMPPHVLSGSSLYLLSLVLCPMWLPPYSFLVYPPSTYPPMSSLSSGVPPYGHLWCLQIKFIFGCGIHHNLSHHAITPTSHIRQLGCPFPGDPLPVFCPADSLWCKSYFQGWQGWWPSGMGYR